MIKGNSKFLKFMRLFALGYMGGTIYLLMYVRYVFYDQMMAALQCTNAQLGFLNSVCSLVSLPLGFIGPYWVDVYKRQILGRLKFDEHKLDDVTSGIESLISIKDPIKQTVFRRELDEGLVLERVTCPIGVIGLIFESRPDARVQISALCIKSCLLYTSGKRAREAA